MYWTVIATFATRGDRHDYADMPREALFGDEPRLYETRAAAQAGADRLMQDLETVKGVTGYLVDLVDPVTVDEPDDDAADALVDIARTIVNDDSSALDAIARMIRENEWNADLCAPICAVLKAAGRNTERSEG